MLHFLERLTKVISLFPCFLLTLIYLLVHYYYKRINEWHFTNAIIERNFGKVGLLP